MPVTRLRFNDRILRATVRLYLFISYVQSDDGFRKSKIYSFVKPKYIYIYIYVYIYALLMWYLILNILWFLGVYKSAPHKPVCLLVQLRTAALRLIVRSWLDVPTFATRRLHACHHARAPSGGR